MSDNAPSELRLAVRALRPYVVLALGFSTVITLLQLAPIGYMRDVYGPVMDSRSEHTLWMVTLILVAALAMTAVLEWVRGRIMAAAAVKFSERMGQRVFDATFMANLARHPASRMALTDLRLVRNFITSPSMVAMMDAPLGLFFLVLVFMIHPLMGMLSLVGAVLVLAIGIWSERKVNPQIKQAQRFASTAQVFIADATRNAQTVEAMGMRGAVQLRWMTIQNEFLRFQAKASMAQALGMTGSRIVTIAQGSLVMGMGVLLTITDVLPPQAGAFLIIGKLLGAKAVAPVMQLINSWKQVAAAWDSYERLEMFLGQFAAKEERMPMPAPKGHLAVEGVAVRAPATKKTIQVDVTCHVKQGMTLAILGPSGSGKSSLAKVLLGIWPPLVGSVRLDGVDVSTWDKAELGPHLGYLPQDVELFDGTIAENIARFGDVDMDKVKAAAALAGIESFVDELPDGLNTMMGADGVMLSGGQRQRVGLARALYDDPKLVVLDEPNSSLDERGDIALIQAILKLKARGTTVVLITHRMNLVQLSDQILLLGDGKPDAYGPRDQVLARLGVGKPAAAPAAAPAPVAPANLNPAS